LIRAAASESLKRVPPAGSAMAAATGSLVVVRRVPPAGSAGAAATETLKRVSPAGSVLKHGLEGLEARS